MMKPNFQCTFIVNPTTSVATKCSLRKGYRMGSITVFRNQYGSRS